MSDTSNYRPVAVAKVVSKLLEHFILSNISPFLGTTDNQFGFKASHSTDQCTFLLKQTASYFVTHGSSVHAVFLDASKAVLPLKFLKVRDIDSTTFRFLQRPGVLALLCVFSS